MTRNTIKYNFGQYGEEEYEYDNYDLEDFIKTLTKEQLVEVIYETLDSKTIQEYNLPIGGESLKVYLENNEDILRDLVNEYYNEIFEWFEEEIKEFFVEDAYAEYRDYMLAKKNPNKYYGV